jgi:hypothetical protein
MLHRHLLSAVVCAGLFAPRAPARAQGTGMDHSKHAAAGHDGAPQAGQAAFAALSEIVRQLEADPKTDWSRVDLEALRRHLADMDDVTLRARAAARAVPGGAEFDVTGEGRVAEAIGRLVTEHAAALDRLAEFRAGAEAIPGGVRLTVTAERDGDTAVVARIRGLGFAGLLVTGAHHAVHHLAIARGEGAKAHIH